MRQFSIYHQARWHSFEGQEAPSVADLLSFETIGGVSLYDKSATQPDEEIFREKQQSVVDILGIGHLWERKILHLSHGESRKVHIAQALIRSPQLVILDNPFVGLDSESREILRKMIDRLLAEVSPHLLLVTTEQHGIPEGITHAAFLENNRIKIQGEKNKVLSSVGEQPKKTSLWVKVNQTPVLPVFSHSRVNEPQEKNAFLIELKNVTVSYGSIHVLRNINWEMRKDEHWAILGPNGSGKTTLLSLILADNPQSYANDITLFGIKRGTGESIWDIKKHIGWVSPELQIYIPFHITCFHVVCSGFFHSIGLHRKCTLQQQETAQKWMQSLGVQQVSDRPFNQISSGEKRLVLLCRALVQSPNLLILDEPCQGLDTEYRTHFLKVLDGLCLNTPLRMIFTTHYFHHIPRVISHALILDQGQIRQKGSREQVLGW